MAGLRISLAVLLFMAACTPAANVVSMGTPATDTLPAPPPPDLLPVTAQSPLPPQRSNAEMAHDFLDLEFRMESGRRLPRLTRFRGPVTVGFTGPAPATAKTDLDKLIRRIRTESGIDLMLAPPGTAPAIAITFSTRAKLRGFVPSAACWVVPGVASLAEYQSRRASPALDWWRLPRRTSAGVFIPADTSPQEIRDCLHEEIAQALGPLNDLYRLSDSVFNDDNFQSALTGFDMLMLRIHYAPELANGMSEAEVAARLPAILARLNPAGEKSGPPALPRATPRAWIAMVGAALGPTTGDRARLIAKARRFLTYTQAQGWHDARLGLAFFALGRAETAADPKAALAAYTQAYDTYRSLPDGGIHAAHAAMHLAAVNLALGRDDAALGWVHAARPALALARNPALTATLNLIEAAIDDARGRTAQARALRLDTVPLARYGFGAPADVAAREDEIALLAYRGQSGTGG